MDWFIDLPVGLFIYSILRPPLYIFIDWERDQERCTNRLFFQFNSKYDIKAFQKVSMGTLSKQKAVILAFVEAWTKPALPQRRFQYVCGLQVISRGRLGWTPPRTSRGRGRGRSGMKIRFGKTHSKNVWVPTPLVKAIPLSGKLKFQFCTQSGCKKSQTESPSPLLLAECPLPVSPGVYWEHSMKFKAMEQICNRNPIAIDLESDMRAVHIQVPVPYEYESSGGPEFVPEYKFSPMLQTNVRWKPNSTPIKPLCVGQECSRNPKERRGQRNLGACSACSENSAMLLRVGIFKLTSGNRTLHRYAVSKVCRMWSSWLALLPTVRFSFHGMCIA